MNLAEYSLKNRLVVWFISALLAIGGIWAYFGLGKLEDPTFTIKTAVVVTQYPGASALEVENEVTEPLESAIQKLSQLDEVRSLSKPGTSIIYADIKPEFNKNDLPQIWDELRRKVNDAQSQLPPGAGPSAVDDTYGDIYGIYFAVTGDGFAYNELEDTAKDLRRELLAVENVSDVQIGGVQQEVVYIEISRSRMAQMGLPMSNIFGLLQSQNVVSSAGSIHVEDSYIRIEPTGYFRSPEDIADLVISGTGGSALRLRDIATVTRGYIDPAQSIMRYNGKPAVGLGISGTTGTNIVDLGASIRDHIDHLEGMIPLGMELNTIYFQPDTVDDAIANFMLNLIEAVVIVIGVLLIFMGIRSGLLIGGVLLLIILSTFIVMYLAGIELQSISLGALIIALGMLVDNAIVVVDGILIGIQGKKKASTAALDIIRQTQMPLLGATVIAALCFAPIGFSPDTTGDFAMSLFQVVAISLVISWVLAITTTPVAGVAFLKPTGAEGSDPYGSKLYRTYTRFLKFCLHKRKLVACVMVAMFVLAVFGMQFVEFSFFPTSNAPRFTVDFWERNGTHIDKTLADAVQLEQFVMAQPETKKVTTYVGDGAVRFLLTYFKQDPAASYAQLIVEFEKYEDYQPMKKKIEEYARTEMPHIDPQIAAFAKGNVGAAKIEARFFGKDVDTLRSVGEQALAAMKEHPDVTYAKYKWGDRTLEIHPRMGDIARKSGLSRTDMAQALQMAYSGVGAGIYRENDKLMRIVARLPQEERTTPDGIADTQIWSPGAGTYVPLGEMVDEIATVAVDPMIYRNDRVRNFSVQCDSASGKSVPLFSEIRPLIEAIPLPPGVTLEWGGEYEMQQKAMGGLIGLIPVACILIVMILVMLFNGFKQPVMILACLPLALIGVAVGFVVSGKPFDFIAVIGFISLTGMIIKNAIVLLDQIELEIREGKPAYDAILDSGVSRVRPVMMAAVTTVLGVVPLWTDTLYGGLSVTIIFGLTFATLLTLVFVPVLYALWVKA